MKTSTYILISFFGFIIVARFVLYTDSLKVNKNDSILDYNNAGKIMDYTALPSKKLGSFSVIVAEAEADILIMQDSVNSVVLWHEKTGYTSEMTNYQIRNDTLFVSKTNSPSQTTIRCQSLHGILGQSQSSIFINKFNIDSLSIDLDGSRLNVSINYQSVQRLEIIATNNLVLFFQINQSDIASLKVDVNHTRLDVFGDGDFQEVSVNLQNNSLFNLQGKRKKLAVESDAYSTYNLYNR